MIESKPPFRVLAYVTSGIVPEIIPYDRLTHINYAFLIPNADGTFVPVVNGWKLQKIVTEAHAAGVQVLISVGGWGWEKEFEALAADPASRAAFVQNLAAFVADYNLDGADIDWEYPQPGQSAPCSTVTISTTCERIRHHPARHAAIMEQLSGLHRIRRGHHQQRRWLWLL
jgi:chitinase